MADTEQVEEVYEHELEKKSSPVLTDFLRMIGGTDSMSYKVLVSDIAKAIVEQYKGSSLAGSAQSIKAALDSLNSKCLSKNSTLTSFVASKGGSSGRVLEFNFTDDSSNQYVFAIQNTGIRLYSKNSSGTWDTLFDIHA